MKKLITLFILLGLSSALYAQTADYYTITNGGNGSLAKDMNNNDVIMSSGTIQLVGGNIDNGSSGVINMVFPFTFMGTVYSQFSASSNGAIRLGSTAMSSVTYGNHFPVASAAIIAPYFQNLKTNSSGKVHYKTVGTYPSRTLVVEFLNMGLDHSSGSADGTFQVRLYEGSNIIEYVYGNMVVNSVSSTPSNRIAVIGFSRNTGASEQLSLDQADYTISTSATPLYNTNSVTGELPGLSSAADGSRKYFRFTPAIPYKSQFISMNTGSSSWCMNELRQVSVTVKNAGTMAWTNSGPSVKIGAKWTSSAFQVTDAGNLAPGDTATYYINVTAPAVSGSNTLTFDVLIDGDCVFSDNSGTCGPGNLTYYTSATIQALPTATIAYGSAAYCTSNTGASINRSGTSGGTYSAMPAGLDITPSTGRIYPNNSSAGTYIVTYTFTNGTCSNTTSTTVTIHKLPTATFSYTGSPYCKNGINPLPEMAPGSVSGTFTSTAGLVFGNSSTGEINLSASTAGTYVVTNTIPASSPCAAVVSTSSITITAVPVATFSYPLSSYCSNGTNPSPVFSGGGSAGTFSSTTGLVFVNTSTGVVNLSSSTPGTYIITNTKDAAGGCGIVTATSSITIEQSMVAGTLSKLPNSTAVCTGASVSATLSAGSGGTGTITDVLQYSYDGGAWQTYTSGTSLTTAGYSSVSIRTYRTATGGCTTSSVNTVSWNIVAQPVAGTIIPSDSPGNICAGEIVSATFTSGSGGTGIVTDKFQYRYNNGAWINYTPGGNLATLGYTTLDFRTFRTATGTGCTQSAINMITYVIDSRPTPPSITPTPAAGNICPGTNVSVTGLSGTHSNTTYYIEYRLNEGPWVDYVPGTNISSVGNTSIDVRSYKKYPGNACGFSTVTTVSWTVQDNVSGSLTPSPVTGAICTGSTVSAILTPGTGGSGTVTETTQYRYNGGTWQTYTSGTPLATSGYYSVDIRTYRSATGSYCTVSADSLVSWTIVAQPSPGTITPSLPAGPICSGTNVSATVSTGTGGTGSINDISEYRLNGGAWLAYVSGSLISTTGNSSIDIRTYRTATGINCNTSAVNTVSWTIAAPVVAGALNRTPTAGIICEGTNVSAIFTPGTGGGGTVTETLEYRINNGTWLSFTSGAAISSAGATVINIRTVRTASGANCGSDTRTYTWNVVSQPAAGTLNPTISAGSICQGSALSVTFTPGSGGTGTSTDVLEYRYNGGAWANYTSGSSLNTSANSSVDVRTYRTSTGTGCTNSGISTLSWAITPIPSATVFYDASPFCDASGVFNVIRTGTAGGTYTSSPGLQLNSTTGEIDISTSAYGLYTVTYSIAANGGCPSYSVSTPVVVNPYTWTGNLNTDWNTAGNWAGNAVPATDCRLVYIPVRTNMPVISSGSFAITDLELEDNATLTLNNAALAISGTIVSKGGINASKGTIELNGSVRQIIEGGYFANKTISTLINSNPSGIEVSNKDSLLIASALLFGEVSSSIIFTSDILTLLSRDTATARVGIIKDGNKIDGKLTVERFIPNHPKAWQMLAAPTIGQSIKNSWQEGATSITHNPNPGYGTMITGSMNPAIPYGFDISTPGNGSIKSYHAPSGSWLPIPNTTDPVGMKPFMIFVRGDRSVITSSAPATKTILRSTGTIHQPSEPPAEVLVDEGKFAAVANPYPSAIDFSQLTRNGGIADMFYVWDPKLSGGYGYGSFQTFTSNYPAPGFTVTPGGGSYSGGNTNIESGIAFLVYAPYAQGSIGFEENCKVSGSYSVARPGGLPDQIKMNLNVMRNGTPQLLDGVLLKFDPAYSDAIDIMDAPKLLPSSEAISISSNNKNMSVEGRSRIAANDTIQYSLTQLRQQQYQLEVIAQDMSENGRTAFVEDLFLNQLTPVNLEGSTIVPFTVNSNPGSYAAKRFRIVFRQATALPVNVTGITARRTGYKTADVSWKVENEIAIARYEIQKSTDGRNFESAGQQTALFNNSGSGAYSFTDQSAEAPVIYYRVVAVNLDGALQYSSIVKIVTTIDPDHIRVYPNPVRNNNLNIQFDISGSYNIDVYSESGKLVYSSRANVVTGNSTQSFKLPATLSKGIYHLRVKDDKDVHNVIQVQVQ